MTTAVFAFAGDSTDTTATTESTDSVTSETLAISEATTSDAAAVDQDADTPPLQGCDQAAEGPGGPYDSTCDGSPSGNGEGDGNATGEPCAGCVGAADDMNPSGQLPGPEDNNNGYECDGNSGIAKTNPAHTGCEATTIVTTTTTPVTTTTSPVTTTVPQKIEICHATGSETNPYILIGPDVHGVIAGHLNDNHQHQEDVVPPFDFEGVHYEQNWDAEGQALIAAGCVVESTTIVTTTTEPPTTTFPTTTTLPEEDKASICHATGSESNPFVLIGPSPVGVIYGHLGMDHQNGEDIIPPFTYNGVVYSQNWDAAGQAIFDAGCIVEGTTIVSTTTIPDNDVTLCHATGSEESPYVKVTVSADEAYNTHYLGDADDIIPPFTYQGTDYELNWTAENQVKYALPNCFVLGTTIVNTTTTTSSTTTTLPDTTTTTEPPTVFPTQITQVGGLGGPHPSKPVLPRRNPPDRVLPFTGSDPSPFLGMAGVLMAVGGSLVLASRRRRTVASF